MHRPRDNLGASCHSPPPPALASPGSLGSSTHQHAANRLLLSTTQHPAIIMPLSCCHSALPRSQRHTSHLRCRAQHHRALHTAAYSTSAQQQQQHTRQATAQPLVMHVVYKQQQQQKGHGSQLDNGASMPRCRRARCNPQQDGATPACRPAEHAGTPPELLPASPRPAAATAGQQRTGSNFFGQQARPIRTHKTREQHCNWQQAQQ